MATDWLLGAFADSGEQAVAGYRRRVEEGIGAPGPWAALKNPVFLGSEPFVERMQGMIDPTRPLQEIPRRQRRTVAKPLVYDSARCADRDQAIAQAYRSGAYSMEAITEHFQLGRMRVSRAVKRHGAE